MTQNEKCVIDQPAGLGDIWFCQKIGYHYQLLGYHVIWPIIPEFAWLREYMDNFEYPLVNKWVQPDCLRIPLRRHKLLHPSQMCSKYMIVGLGYSDWFDYFHFKRNTKREHELFNLLVREEPFVLANKMFGSPPKIYRNNFKVDSKLPVVELKLIDGFTLLDWSMIVERAEEIWTVDTSLHYLADKLDLKATRLELFSRFATLTGKSSFHVCEPILRRKWNLNYQG